MRRVSSQALSTQEVQQHDAGSGHPVPWRVEVVLGLRIKRVTYRSCASRNLWKPLSMKEEPSWPNAPRTLLRRDGTVCRWPFPDATALSTMAPLWGGDASGIRKAALFHALLVRLAGPATPLEADPVAQVLQDVRATHRPSIDTPLSIPFATGPDGGAVPSVAKPIAALGVVRAIAIRDVLRPNFGQRGGPGVGRVPRQTVIRDRLIE